MKKIILLAAICALCTQAHSQWFLTGNTGTNPSTNFIGTTDNKAFKIRTNNSLRMYITSTGKIGIGNFTPVFKLDVKGGSINTDSVYRIKGNTVLSVNGTNTFTGIASGSSNTGEYNTANGNSALYYNTSGYWNTANGYNALYYNDSGYFNTANGCRALYSNINGNYNTANGTNALQNNTTGTNNTAFGHQTLVNGGSGSYNTAVGSFSSQAFGANPSNFSAIGYNTGYILSNSNTMEIGNASVSWIGGQSGFFNYSDKRIKDNIQSNVPGLSFITKLNPVTYNLNIHRQNEICNISDTAQWEGKYDIEKITQTGFLAQEVEQAAKENNYDFNGVRAPHGNGKLYSIQYASFVVPLVKAVQELSKQNNDLKTENDNLKSRLDKIEQMLTGSDNKQSLTVSNIALLEQNIPNPFNQQTIVHYTIPTSYSSAIIQIADMSGHILKTQAISQPGKGALTVNANELAAGSYQSSLIVDGKVIDSKQMVLTK